MFKSILWAGAGGFIGTVMRFLSEKLGHVINPEAVFPIGTFIANIAGCFLIGIFYGWAVKTQKLSKSMNVFLITGLCGGFTTFSSFSDELEGMLVNSQDPTFWIYLCTSIVLGIIMVAVGMACVRPQKAALKQS